MCVRVALSLLLLCILLDSVHSQEWTHHTILDGDGMYHLSWNPPENMSGDSEITFRVEVQVTGYIGLGFSPNGGMPGSDIITGWIKDGEVYFQDRHADAFSLPNKDDQQDYTLMDAYENDTFTVFVFRRKLNTCDKDDWVIDESTVRILYAYSKEDPESDDPFYHHQYRGAKSIILIGTKIKEDPNLNFTSLLQWEVMSPNVDFSSSDTLYWCKIHKSPQVSEKHHVVYNEHPIQEGHRQFVHHMVLFECVGGTAEEYEIYLDDNGHECYTSEMPMNMFKCQGTVAGWAVGAHDFAFPEHVGFPIDPGPPKYYMLETHYDNQQLVNASRDSSGFRFYYTPILRKYDVGQLIVGASVSPRTFIPPGQDQYIVVGHGNPECVTMLYPDSGAKALGIFLHAHVLARAIKVRHFRGNEELKPFSDDKYYDFNYQAYRFFPEEVTVLPTDHISIECTYNSTGRTKVTHGGLSTRDEMCEIMLLYYPRVNRAISYSASTFDTINRVLNINVTNDDDLDPVLDSYDWDTVDIDYVQNVIRDAAHETQCYYLGPYQDGENNNSMTSYPKDVIPYEPSSICS